MQVEPKLKIMKALSSFQSFFQLRSRGEKAHFPKDIARIFIKDIL